MKLILNFKILKHLLTISLTTLLSVYLLIGAQLYFNQTKIIYHPDNSNFYDCKNFPQSEQTEHKGTRFYYRHQSDRLVIHYHGNAGTACRSSYLKNIYKPHNLSYIFVEYAGYGGDQNQPSDEKILTDVRNINDFIQNKNYQEIIILGQSLGSGPGSYHTTLRKIDKLILLTTFSSTYELASYYYKIYPIKLLLKEDYNNLKYLQNYQGQLIIIHGETDEVLPYELAHKLYENLNIPNKKLIKIPNGNHNKLLDYQQVRDTLQQALKN